MMAYVQEAVRIRAFENCLLEFFKSGFITGTVHTCLGQEMNATVLMSLLSDRDFVTSNHRGHGHYLARTKDYRGLLAEIMGKGDGICNGIGGTQHLATKSFLANGVQGGSLPSAVGLAWAKKILNQESIVVSFIGDGTFGEGIVYEALNISSLIAVPLLVVVENNKIAQSTPTVTAMAGTISARVEAFGIQVFSADSNSVEDLQSAARDAINFVREKRQPAVLVIASERLGSHSKGDDTRSPDVLKSLWSKDYLQSEIANSIDLQRLYSETVAHFQSLASELYQEPNTYKYPERMHESKLCWKKYDGTSLGFWGQELSEAFSSAASRESALYFIGEDVGGDYGGAFKISKAIAKRFPDRVVNMPISEAAITGVALGMAMGGLRPFAEIMFGDFLTLAADQIVNHAAKFEQLYEGLFPLGMVVRTPMGGYRGYGATHSQSLEKMFLGIPGLRVVSPSLLYTPEKYLEDLMKDPAVPTLAIENKTMYTEKASELDLSSFDISQSDKRFPIFWLKPKSTTIAGTLLCYGGMFSKTVDAANELFVKHDTTVQVIVITELFPLDLAPLIEMLPVDSAMLFVEEGTSFSSLSGEVSYQLKKLAPSISFERIGSEAKAIPAARVLEDQVLPGVDKIVDSFIQLLRDL